VKKVLVLDDSEIVRNVVAMVLGSRDIAVVELGEPRRLGALVAAEAPDLVLLDVAIPGARVEALVAEARARGARRVVLYSDRPDAELARATGLAGADGYVRKGGDPGAFALHVGRLLEG
jgi:DNA-binding NarL/FixJ family response regulator